MLGVALEGTLAGGGPEPKDKASVMADETG